MNKKSKIKWFFLGVFAGWLPIIAIAIFILIQANLGDQHDPFDDIRPDMGEKVSEFLRPSTGISTIMPLGNTPFMATVGPSRYQDENDNDWDYYTISVQKKEGKSSYVFFERQFKIEDIPKELVNKTANEIASYDKKQA
jgi:hypothetical protein